MGLMMLFTRMLSFSSHAESAYIVKVVAVFSLLYEVFGMQMLLLCCISFDCGVDYNG